MKKQIPNLKKEFPNINWSYDEFSMEIYGEFSVGHVLITEITDRKEFEVKCFIYQFNDDLDSPSAYERFSDINEIGSNIKLCLENVKDILLEIMSSIDNILKG